MGAGEQAAGTEAGGKGGEGGGDGEKEQATTTTTVAADAVAGETESQDLPSGGLPGEEDDEAETGAEGDEGADTESTEEEPKESRGVGSLKKRVGKLTARAKQAEERASALEAEVAALKSSPDGPRAGGPIAGANGIDPVMEHPFVKEVSTQLETQDRAYQSAAMWLGKLERNPEDTLAALQKGGVTAESVEEATEMLAALRESAFGERASLRAERNILVKQARAEFARQGVEYDRVAEGAYAWMKKEESPERQMFDKILKQAPWLGKYPEGRLSAADMVAGAMARRAKAPKAAAGRQDAGGPSGLPLKKVVKASSPAPVANTRGGSAPRVDAGKVKVGEAEQKFKGSGRVGDLTELLRARREERAAAAA